MAPVLIENISNRGLPQHNWRERKSKRRGFRNAPLC